MSRGADIPFKEQQNDDSVRPRRSQSASVVLHLPYLFTKETFEMNYFSDNSEVRELVLKLLGGGFSNAKRINFSVSYAQNRKLSIITIEAYPSSTIHALIFIYTRSLRLFDVLAYRGRLFRRINRSGDALKRLDRINQFILKKIPRLSPIAIKRIKEGSNRDSSNDLKTQQIQHLKDRIRIEKESNRSLRNQLKALRARQNRSLR